MKIRQSIESKGKLIDYILEGTLNVASYNLISISISEPHQSFQTHLVSTMESENQPTGQLVEHSGLTLQTQATQFCATQSSVNIHRTNFNA